MNPSNGAIGGAVLGAIVILIWLEKFKIEISVIFEPWGRLRDEKEVLTTCRSN